MKCTRCRNFTSQALTRVKKENGKIRKETYLICDGPCGLDLIEETWALDEEKYCEFYDEELDDHETKKSKS